MNPKYKEGQIVYTVSIYYDEKGYISTYSIGTYEVESIEKNKDLYVYIIKNIEKNTEFFDDLIWRGRKLECELYETKKEIYEELLEEYETDLYDLKNWYNRKEKYMTDDIKVLKQIIKNN